MKEEFEEDEMERWSQKGDLREWPTCDNFCRPNLCISILLHALLIRDPLEASEPTERPGRVFGFPFFYSVYSQYIFITLRNNSWTRAATQQWNVNYWHVLKPGLATTNEHIKGKMLTRWLQPFYWTLCAWKAAIQHQLKELAAKQ